MAQALISKRSTIAIYGPIANPPAHHEQDSLVSVLEDGEEFGSGEIDPTKFYIVNIPGTAQEVMDKYLFPKREPIIKKVPKVVMKIPRTAQKIFRIASNNRSTIALARFKWDSGSSSFIDTEAKDNGQFQ